MPHRHAVTFRVTLACQCYARGPTAEAHRSQECVAEKGVRDYDTGRAAVDQQGFRRDFPLRIFEQLHRRLGKIMGFGVLVEPIGLLPDRGLRFQVAHRAPGDELFLVIQF